MDPENGQYLPYEQAKRMVGAVMEEEHIHEHNRRVLTVYDTSERELCWFDAGDIMAEMAASEGGIPRGEDDMKAKAVELILRQLPKWVAGEE